MRLLGRRLSRGCEVEWRRGLDSLVEEGKGEVHDLRVWYL